MRVRARHRCLQHAMSAAAEVLAQDADREQQRGAGRRRRGRQQQHDRDEGLRARCVKGSGKTQIGADRSEHAWLEKTALPLWGVSRSRKRAGSWPLVPRSRRLCPPLPPPNPHSHYLTRPVSRRFPLHRKSGAHGPRSALYFSPTSSPWARRLAPLTCRL